MSDSTIKNIPDDIAAELLELARMATAEPWLVEEGEHSGENWPVAFFGDVDQMTEDGQVDDGKPLVRVQLVSDHLHASERFSNAREEAAWCVRAQGVIRALAWKMTGQPLAGGKKKTVHRAAFINYDGDASALCFKKKQRINLARSSWTNRDDVVTCRRCLREMRLRALTEDPTGDPIRPPVD